MKSNLKSKIEDFINNTKKEEINLISREEYFISLVDMDTFTRGKKLYHIYLHSKVSDHDKYSDIIPEDPVGCDHLDSYKGEGTLNNYKKQCIKDFNSLDDIMKEELDFNDAYSKQMICLFCEEGKLSFCSGYITSQES